MASAPLCDKYLFLYNFISIYSEAFITVVEKETSNEFF